MSNKNLPLDFSSLEEKLGHTFADKELLRLALTHSSYANEQRAKGQPIKCNERLEFLGDSVLSVIVSDYIYRNYPDLPEGELTKIRAGSVCERALGVYANDIHLGDYLYMGKGEENTNGRTRVSILSDAFEATLAALYLDAGIETVRPFLLPYVTEEIRRILRSGHTEDFKTMLQQIVQQEQGELLEYVLVEESGPAHNRRFTVEAHLNSNVIGRGEGHTKREAEQNAARSAIQLFGVETPDMKQKESV